MKNNTLSEVDSHIHQIFQAEPAGILATIKRGEDSAVHVYGISPDGVFVKTAVLNNGWQLTDWEFLDNVNLTEIRQQADGYLSRLDIDEIGLCCTCARLADFVVGAYRHGHCHFCSSCYETHIKWKMGEH